MLARKGVKHEGRRVGGGAHLQQLHAALLIRRVPNNLRDHLPHERNALVQLALAVRGALLLLELGDHLAVVHANGEAGLGLTDRVTGGASEAGRGAHICLSVERAEKRGESL